MFDGLQEKLQGAIQGLRSQGKVSKEVLDAALREIRLALLEADVNFRVVKAFVGRIRERAEGEAVLDSLTPQERRIFDLIGGGSTNRQIAEELFLAEKTIKNHITNLMAKLGMSRRTEAAALAARIEERRRRRFD